MLSLLVLSVALIIRVVYLIQSADNPTFRLPVVDSRAYHHLAQALAGGARPDTDLFWQPPLYPLFLSFVYRALGPCIACARFIQTVIGAGACVLVFWIGRVALSRRVGLLAGLITALCGPLLFFELELLGEGLAVFWTALLILLFLLTRESDHPLLYFATGLCGAMAVLTRPPLLLFLLAGCGGVAVCTARRMSPRRAAAAMVLVAVGFGLLAWPVADLNRRATGHFGILPHSAGINLYVGNNPEWEKTVSARPGYEWTAISRIPLREGITDVWEASDHFKGKVAQYVQTEPGLFLAGLAKKTVRFLNSREIPRNIDIYTFRTWSPLLSALVWKYHGFGFPFGLLWPLAIYGLVTCRRRVPFPLWAFLLLYPAAIILYFVSSRYRVLMVPTLSVLAAAGLVHLCELLASRRIRSVALSCLVLVALGILSSLPASFAEEEINYEADLYRSIGRSLYEDGNAMRAVRYLDKALEIEPDLADALNDLACAEAALGRDFDAMNYVMRALAIVPDHPGYLYNLGSLTLNRGALKQAEQLLAESVRLDGAYEDSRVALAVCLLQQGRQREAAEHVRRVLEMNPANARAAELLTAAEAAPPR